MFVRTLVVIALAGVVVGCAAIEPVQIVGPSGKTAYTMRCSGAGRTLEACYKKALFG
jgi:hypothetical protein